MLSGTKIISLLHTLSEIYGKVIKICIVKQFEKQRSGVAVLAAAVVVGRGRD